jgi:hypothetical protein
MSALGNPRITAALRSVGLGLLFVAGSALGDLLPLREKSNLSREPGAIYLEDFLDKPVRMQLSGAVPIYAGIGRDREIGMLRKDQEVEILAMTDDQYRVRGRAQHGQVAGWILAEQVVSKDKDFRTNLRKMYERQVVVQELIENQQVALGMNIEEVTAALGKPSRKSSKLTKEGRSDVFEYSTYERVPQYRYARDNLGRVYKQTYYVQVETGKVEISFKNEVVESIEDKEGAPGTGEVKIVPFPIELF